MKKAKWMFLVVAVIILFSIPVASAAGKLSTIEQKWLEFQREVKNQMVKDGKITQQQADAYLKDLETKMQQSDEDIIYRHFAEGEHGKGQKYMGKAVEIYAKLTNRSAEDVMKACQDAHMTIFELAEKEGNLDKLKEAVLVSAREHLSKKVQDGSMTKEQMEQKLERLKSMMGNTT